MLQKHQNIKNFSTYLFDLAESKGFNLGETIYEKLEYNSYRADHKIKNRLKEGGKKF